MTFISYAQNFEDIMLWRALKHVQKGFYIDVGAYLPSDDSVTRAFYDKDWNGINVEPNPKCLTQLIQARPRDINLGIAIGQEEGTVDLFIIADTGLTTVVSDIAKEHETTGLPSARIDVPCLKLSSLWKEYVPNDQEVHFLKIDVEGNEEDALLGMDWVKNRPWIVVVESTYPRSQTENHEDWEHILLNANYIMAYWDGLNRFYVAREHSELLPAFSAPPNFFDGFELARFRETAEANRIEIARLSHELQIAQENLARQTELRLAAEKKKVAFTPRPFLARLFFRSTGRPRHLVWRFFFHKNGRPRGEFKHLVFHKDGRPHGEFREWVESAEYLSLPGAVRRQAQAPLVRANLTDRAEYFLTRLKSERSKDTSE